MHSHLSLSCLVFLYGTGLWSVVQLHVICLQFPSAMATKSPTLSLLLPYDSSDEESNLNDQISDAEEPCLLVDEVAPGTSASHGDLADQISDAEEPCLLVDEAVPGTSELEPSTSTAVVKSASKRKNPYALGLNQLPMPFQRFLAEVKSFFTGKVNLQRQSSAVSASTFSKVQERILCKYFLFMISLFSIRPFLGKISVNCSGRHVH